MTNDDTVGEAFENQETRWSEIVDDNVTLGVNTTISWEIYRARISFENDQIPTRTESHLHLIPALLLKVNRKRYDLFFMINER